MKRGSSHVDFIIAFGIFITITIILIVYLNPIKEDNNDKSKIIDLLQDSFMKKTETEVIFVFVKSNDFCSPPGFNLNASSINISEGNYTIIFSEEFETVINTCAANSFSLGSVRKEKILSNKKINKFKNDYISNYSEIKDSLGIPKKYDFAIFQEGEILDIKKPEEVDVYSKKEELKVVYSNGTIANKIFYFEIWG